jgi:4-hydroxyacetophenone monooxygenase
MVQARADALEIREDVFEKDLRRFDAEHEKLIWSHPGMSTYYRNKHGRVFSVMPWRFVDYWSMTHDADLSEFVLDSTEDRRERVASDAVA